ncbi:DUF1183 domain protein [Talaromyces stipitatus ATCC 10500]|uniref:Store-operated calcium entry-associated regulatory factor n=1 Tax=Talaromyces stipitatus (strain ATCC 10500 / CBS 375.48 / QM 6759 / NRRL 1006) TaxID=441959 RepID=B8MSP3_TALSN|nr:DUF1183 domain protein [Talaromyces stipitatus ATCC 10500]EED12480.1 DUF1183 domain protein [Talaromyces stipitatus ATCC 10500]
MKGICSVYILLLLSILSTALSETPPSPNAVRLSNVQTLTLRAGRQTSHRRVLPLPQLKCVGPEQGYDYDEEDVQWSCSANLPSEFKLGSTDVICEGYRNADDKWILKGSCGVEYRLLLTEKGEERYGRWRQSSTSPKSGDENNGVGKAIMVIFFIALLFIIIVAITGGPNRDGNRGRRPRNTNRGGGGGDGDDDDPPPPYDYQPQSSRQKSDSGPGFWTGAAAGSAAAGAAGYAMGRRHDRRDDRQTRAGSSYTRRYDYDPEPAPGPSRSFSPGRSDTGFGSTRRR